MTEGMFHLSQPLIGRISKTWGVTAMHAVTGRRWPRRRRRRHADRSATAATLRHASKAEASVAGIVAHPGIVIAHSSDAGSLDRQGRERHAGDRNDAGAEAKERCAPRASMAKTGSGHSGRSPARAGSLTQSVDAAAARSLRRAERALAALLLIAVIVGATIAAAAYAARRIARPDRRDRGSRAGQGRRRASMRARRPKVRAKWQTSQLRSTR